MIFRRRLDDSAPQTGAPVAASPGSPEVAADSADLGAAGPVGSVDAAVDDKWLAFDLSRDWREDGPFDISEVDLDADDVERIDVGALVVTPEPGLKIQLVMDQRTQQAETLLAIGDGFSLQLNVLAAPAELGFVAEHRERVIGETIEASGSVELAEGPFGTELRRVVPVTDASGQTGPLAVRDWLVQGPRWLLHIRLTGQAVADTAGQGPAAQLEEFCRNLIVRRDETARVPGTPVPLRPPEPK